MQRRGRRRRWRHAGIQLDHCPAGFLHECLSLSLTLRCSHPPRVRPRASRRGEAAANLRAPSAVPPTVPPARCPASRQLSICCRPWGSGTARGGSASARRLFDCGGALFIEHNPVVVLTAGVTATSRVLPVLTCDSVGGHASDNAKPEQCQPPPEPPGTLAPRECACWCTQLSRRGGAAHRCDPCHVIRYHGRTGSS